MRLSYFGHSCVLLEANNGCRVLFDPFQPGAFGGRFALEPFRGAVDAVVSSHSHLDHYHIDPSFGAPILVQGPGQVRGVRFSCVEVSHGRPGGVDHGPVKVFRAVADGVSFIHMGDTGEEPGQAVMESLGRPDVLVIPVGGRFTMGPAAAAATVRAWKPRMAIPVHYADPLVKIELEPLSSFLALMDDVVTVDEPLEVVAGALPEKTRTVVMKVVRQPRRT